MLFRRAAIAEGTVRLVTLLSPCAGGGGEGEGESGKTGDGGFPGMLYRLLRTLLPYR